MSSRSSNYTVVQSPNDCANMMQTRRHRLYAELPDLPGMGYRTFFVKPLDTAQPQPQRFRPW